MENFEMSGSAGSAREEIEEKEGSAETGKKEIEGNEGTTNAITTGEPSEEKQRKWMELFVEMEKKLGILDYIRMFAHIRSSQEDLRQNNDFSTLIASHPNHYIRNRYRDILPYDSNRVILKAPSKDNLDGYINASHVLLPHSLSSFIAAQAPLPSTLEDFWEMADEQGVKLIVMLCKLVEICKVKCERYWPENVGDTAIYGAYEVTLEEEKRFDDDEYTLRRLTLRKDSERRNIQQLHYREWPDHGCPTGSNQLLNMIEKMGEMGGGEGMNKPPILVHCSAGVGRTGTIIVINHVRELILQNRFHDVHLLQLVLALRRQRSSMVQTQDQFQFVHRCVSSYCRRYLGLTEEEPVYLPSLPSSQVIRPVECEDEDEVMDVPDYPDEPPPPRGPENVNGSL